MEYVFLFVRYYNICVFCVCFILHFTFICVCVCCGFVLHASHLHLRLRSLNMVSVMIPNYFILVYIHVHEINHFGKFGADFVIH